MMPQAGVWRATCAAGVGFGVDRSKKSLYLAVSRGVGDRMLKKPTPVLTARPDVVVKPLGEDDLFCVLVCDGVTDVLDDQRIVDVAAEHLSDPEEAARKVVKEASGRRGMPRRASGAQTWSYICARPSSSAVARNWKHT